LVSADFVTKIGLMTRAHTYPYYIQWLNNSDKTKVTHTTHIHFSIGIYHDYADCDVVSMQAYSLLLGHPWEFDTDVVHYGRANKYTLMHKGKKLLYFLLRQIKLCNMIGRWLKLLNMNMKFSMTKQHLRVLMLLN
jgi:hypothetical protein